MKQPDDHRQPEAPFQKDETAGDFFDIQENRPIARAVERSFETQSGYLVLIKQLGSRYALSFKRQIGTPPTSSIFLTADEGQRLANIFNSDPRRQNENRTPADELKENIEVLRALRKRRKSLVTNLALLFFATCVLCAAIAVFATQTQFIQSLNR